MRCTSAARESLERARVRNLPLHRHGAMCLSGAPGVENIARIPASPGRAGSEEDGYRLTRDFVIAMMEHFRRQKTIHRRFAFQIVLEVRARAAARHACRPLLVSPPGSAPV